MQKNTKAFSLIFVMGIVLVTSLLAVIVLEYIVPFSRSVVGMENSSKAYYLANSGLEQGFYQFKKYNYSLKNAGVSISLNGTHYSDKKNDNLDNFKYEQVNLYKDSNSASKVTMKFNDKKEPLSGEGDSEYDKNFNQIAVGNSIQMRFKGGVTGAEAVKKWTFSVKVPKMSNLINVPGTSFSNNISNHKLEPDPDKPNKKYLSIQLSSVKGFRSMSFATGAQLNSGNFKVKFSELKDENGKYGELFINGESKGNYDFFTVAKDRDKLDCRNNDCSLKVSVIEDLTYKSGTKFLRFPYLEWKLEASTDFKLRRFYLDTEGKSYGYVKKLSIKVPQSTLNEAFDFTVFQ